MAQTPFDIEHIGEALANPSSLMRTLLDNLPDPMFVKDAAQRYLGVNQAYARLIGLANPGDAVGRTDADLLPSEEASRVMADDAETLRAGRPVLFRERRLGLKDGRVVWLSERRVPIPDAAGKAAGLFGMAHDVTPLKAMEQELRNTNVRLSGALSNLKQAQQKIIQSERMNALGEMASGIAHDFNNALMPVLGYSDLLMSRPEIMDDRAHALRIIKDIRTAAMDAAEAVRRLREFYRDTSDEEHERGDINVQVKTAVILTRPRWEAEMKAKGITIRVETTLQDVPYVAAKDSRLREVLINLILNAVDAMPEGGVMTLRTGRDGDRVALAIQDTGVGMTEEVRRRCLEPFFTTKGQAGTGLGLALVYGFVNRHRGRIDIDSAPGKGTTLTLWLPVWTDTGGMAAAAPAAPAPILRGLKILVVDDELTSRALFETYLQTDQHTVVLAACGREGIEKFRRGTFDLVITDRAMPDMSGDEVAQRVRNLEPRVAVLMVTGFADTMEEHGQHPPGVDLVLGKPITHAGLRAAIAEAVSRRKG